VLVHTGRQQGTNKGTQRPRIREQQIVPQDDDWRNNNSVDVQFKRSRTVKQEQSKTERLKFLSLLHDDTEKMNKDKKSTDFKKQIDYLRTSTSRTNRALFSGPDETSKADRLPHGNCKGC
jgi:hypothetical protein